MSKGKDSFKKRSCEFSQLGWGGGGGVGHHSYN